MVVANRLGGDADHLNRRRFTVKTDRDLIIEALEQAQRILAEHFESGGVRPAPSTIHRLVTVLDRPELIAALERMKASRGLRVVK
jgi:hypothetical protein